MPESGRIEHRILAAGDPREPDTMAAAVHAFVEEVWGVDVPLLGAASAEAEPGNGAEDPTSSSEATSDQVRIRPYRGGDFAGDGREDVLVEVSWAPWATRKLEVRSGADGSLLWVLEDAELHRYALPVPIPDVSGDGADDLFLYAIDSGHGYDYVHHVQVRSGQDGSMLWARQFSGVMGEYWSMRTTPVGYEWEAEFRATNYIVLPFISGDHTGDGLPDVVLNAIDVTYRWSGAETGAVAVWSYGQEATVRSSTRAEVLQGASGATVHTRLHDDAPSIGYLEPIGENAAALLWQEARVEDERMRCLEVAVGIDECVEVGGEETLILEAVDGKGFEPLWRRSYALPGAWAEPLGADVTGSGTSDVVVKSLARPTWDRWDLGLGLVDGADGALLWHRDVDARWPLALPAPDHQLLLATAGLVDPDAEHYGEQGLVRLEHVDAATGDTRGSTETVGPTGNVRDVSVARWNDADGDGLDDVTGFIYTHFFQDGSIRASTMHFVASSASMFQLYGFDRPIGNWRSRLQPLGDVDGDGAADTFDWLTDSTVRWVDGRTYPLTEWKIVRPLHGDVLWTFETVGNLSTLMPAGDHSGNDRDDVLFMYHTPRESSNAPQAAALSSLDGATGSQRWTVNYD